MEARIIPAAQRRRRAASRPRPPSNSAALAGSGNAGILDQVGFSIAVENERDAEKLKGMIARIQAG